MNGKQRREEVLAGLAGSVAELLQLADPVADPESEMRIFLDIARMVSPGDRRRL